MKKRFAKILVVDDEASMRHMLRLVLEREGYELVEAADGEEALKLLSETPFSVVLCDIRMPGMDGLALLYQVRERFPQVTMIMMSAYGTIDTAIQCLKQGAYDYISKPFKTDEVVLCLKKTEERLELREENKRLKKDLKKNEGAWELIGESAGIHQVRAIIDQVADSSLPVLITGETGTGKEVVARTLFHRSGLVNGPFVSVNCGAISSGLMESELFGHVKGAFTGAEREREGLFGAADRGVLFLDEIGELPLDLQPKLLRVLQEGEVRKVGETKPAQVNVRIIAATARNLKEEVGQGRFRDDLYYRLNVVELCVPPLRERREDIPVLAEYFIRRIAAKEGYEPPQLGKNAVERLKSYHWPGNVRELLNFMEKTMIFNRGKEIDVHALPWEVRREKREDQNDYSLKEAMKRMEREYICKALAATNGNRTLAAGLLEISLRSLQYKLAEYDLS
ncbi:MAG: sigma-54-dependent Fis family transcriptional regulator [Deltaproteobacteria bacterium]|nr:sigma-54-dependent Fis family transcriptional regulator [Deltaproteobacteria bacterium]